MERRDVIISILNDYIVENGYDDCQHLKNKQANEGSGYMWTSYAHSPKGVTINEILQFTDEDDPCFCGRCENSDDENDNDEDDIEDNSK